MNDLDIYTIKLTEIICKKHLYIKGFWKLTFKS